MKGGLLLVAILSSIIPLRAQNLQSVEKAGTAMGFSVLPADPAILAKGGSGLASDGSPAWASFENIAALSFSPDNLSAGFSYLEFPPGNQSGINVGVSMHIGKKTAFSIGYGRMSGDPYDEMDALGGSLGKYSPSDSRINAGGAFALSDKMSVGAAVHYLSSAIASDSKVNSFSADIMYFGDIGPFAVAAGVRNIGSSIKDSRGSRFNLPSSVCTAGEYEMVFRELSALKVDTDFEYFFEAGFSASFGVDYSFKDLLFARAGAHLGNDLLPSFASLGLGARYAGVSLDVAYLLASPTLGGSLLAGLSYSF